MRSRNTLLLLVALGFLFSTTGCSFSLDWFRQFRAQRAIVRQDYSAALPILQQILINQPESNRALVAARQGVRVAHLEAKQYDQAVDFYRHLVLQSPDANERKNAQRFIAQIYFENLQDFDKAVNEYEKLLKLTHTPEESFRYRLNLAKSHFQMNNVNQTLSELDTLIDQKPSEEGLFEIKMLKANVLVSNRQLNEAALLWDSILKEFPERSAKEKVALNLVVCYEELKEFGKAISLLEGLRETDPNPSFLDLRIERLKERQANMPGAQGFKR